MKPSYEHTQIETLTITAIGGALLFLIILMSSSEFNWIAVLILLILGIALLLFATLKTTIQ